MKKLKVVAKSKKTAADLLTAKKTALEDAVLRLCTAFERDTGLLVTAVIHPRDDGNYMGIGPQPLKEGERAKVNILPPFHYTNRMR